MAQDMTIFVLRLSKLDVEAIDIELLMYYVLKVMSLDNFCIHR